MNGNHFDIYDLKREYEKGRKQGAVEELELQYNILRSKYLNEIKVLNVLDEMQRIEKRFGELEGEQK